MEHEEPELTVHLLEADAEKTARARTTEPKAKEILNHHSQKKTYTFFNSMLLTAFYKPLIYQWE